MISTLIASILLIALSFIGVGIGVLFFGKVAKRDACGTLPNIKSDECANQKAGLCPFEDDTGALKNAKMGQINFNDN